MRVTYDVILLNFFRILKSQHLLSYYMKF